MSDAGLLGQGAHWQLWPGEPTPSPELLAAVTWQITHSAGADAGLSGGPAGGPGSDGRLLESETSNKT